MLFLTEMWERFSFYCMRSLLALYMDETLHLSKHVSGPIYAAYTGLIYFTPLLGGWLADGRLGFRRAVVIGGILMGFGHLSLAFHATPFFFAALALLVLGNGLFKPNISTLVGDLYRDRPDLKDSAFNIFYMGINLGAFFSPIVAAVVRKHWGFHPAFATAAAGMAISLAIFSGFRRHVDEAARTRTAANAGPAASRAPLTLDERARIAALVVIFGIVVFFWTAFSQDGYALTFWVRDCTRTTLPPELYQAVNPTCIIVFTPLLVGLFRVLRARGREPATATKMAFGMALTAGAYALLFAAGRAGGDHGRVSAGWILGSYAAVTLAEILLSPMGLSVVSKLAPARHAGLFMGLWFVAMSVGNVLAGLLGGLWDDMRHSTLFGLLAATSLAAAAVLAALLPWLNGTIAGASGPRE